MVELVTVVCNSSRAIGELAARAAALRARGVPTRTVAYCKCGGGDLHSDSHSDMHMHGGCDAHVGNVGREGAAYLRHLAARLQARALAPVTILLNGGFRKPNKGRVADAIVADVLAAFHAEHPAVAITAQHDDDDETLKTTNGRQQRRAVAALSPIERLERLFSDGSNASTMPGRGTTGYVASAAGLAEGRSSTTSMSDAGWFSGGGVAASTSAAAAAAATACDADAAHRGGGDASGGALSSYCGSVEARRACARSPTLLPCGAPAPCACDVPPPETCRWKRRRLEPASPPSLAAWGCAHWGVAPQTAAACGWQAYGSFAVGRRLVEAWPVATLSGARRQLERAGRHGGMAGHFMERLWRSVFLCSHSARQQRHQHQRPRPRAAPLGAGAAREDAGIMEPTAATSSVVGDAVGTMAPIVPEGPAATAAAATARLLTHAQRVPKAPDLWRELVAGARHNTSRKWLLWNDGQAPHRRDYVALRETSSFRVDGMARDADPGFRYFEARARRINARHAHQNLSTVAAMRAKWHGVTLVGRVPLWELLQHLSRTVDYTDKMLCTTNQWLHTLQVYEGMLLDGITDPKLLFLALVHDIGKLLSLFGEDDANVDGLNSQQLVRGVAGAGMGSVVSQWNHDEFGYTKLRRAAGVPPEVAWVVRWHSFVPLITGRMAHVLTPRERAWMPLLRTLWEYDHKTKSRVRLPEVDLAAAQRIVESFVPEGLEF